MLGGGSGTLELAIGGEMEIDGDPRDSFRFLAFWFV